MRFLSIVFLCFLSHAALGQYGQVSLSVSPRIVLSVESESPVSLHGNLILAEGSAVFTKKSAALVAISTDCKFWDVTARRTWSESGDLVEVSRETGSQELLLTGEPGEYLVEVIAFDAERGIARASAVVRLGEAEPEPPKPPTPNPNLPADFDSLASRVSGWSSGMAKRLEFAAVYRSYARRIIDDPTLTVSGAGALMTTDLQAITRTVDESAKAKIRSVFENINQDLQSRWPLSKALLALYWNCIAAGLEAGQ